MDDTTTRLAEIKSKVTAGQGDFSEVYTRIKQDMTILSGLRNEAFDEEDNRVRGAERAKFSFPVVDKYVERIVGNYNNNPFGVSYTPYDVANQGKARMLGAIAQGIENRSSAKSIYQQALRNAAGVGYGWFYITTEYANDNDDSLDVELRLEPVLDPTCVVIDPLSTKIDGSDAGWAAHISYISEKEAVDTYGEEVKKYMSEGQGFFNNTGSTDSESVGVVTYWEKSCKKSIRYIAKDGTGSDKETKGSRRKEVKKYSVKVVKIVGNMIIAETELDCPYIPLFPVYGRPVMSNGRMQYIGLAHGARDGQRMLNYAGSLGGERLALSPKANFIGPAEGIAPYKEQWANSSRSNPPVLVYDSYTEDGKPIAPPQKQDTAVNVGDILSLQQNYLGIISAVIGIPDEAMFAQSQQETAEAALLRAKSTETVMSVYYENLAASVIHSGRVILHLVNSIYDTERNLPMVLDKKPTVQKLNVADLGIVPSEFDVMVDAGPLLGTQRKDNLRSLLAASTVLGPQYMPALAPQIVKNIDVTDQEELIQMVSAISQMGMNPGDPTLPQQMEALKEQNAQLQQVIAASQLEMIKLQQANNNAQINAQVDLATNAANNQNKIDLELIKQQGAASLQTQKTVNQAELEAGKAMLKAQAEIKSSDMQLI